MPPLEIVTPSVSRKSLEDITVVQVFTRSNRIERAEIVDTVGAAANTGASPSAKHSRRVINLLNRFDAVLRERGLQIVGNGFRVPAFDLEAVHHIDRLAVLEDGE